MKIKCPICYEKDFYNLGSDDRHKIRYHELVEKIHEKIEYFEESGYPHETRILKSLLEDNK